LQQATCWQLQFCAS